MIFINVINAITKKYFPNGSIKLYTGYQNLLDDDFYPPILNALNPNAFVQFSMEVRSQWKTHSGLTEHVI